MKRFITFIMALVMFSAVGFSQTPKKSTSDVINGIVTTYTDSKDAVSTLYNDGKAVIDTVYQDAKGAISTVYSDVKDGTSGIYPDVKAAVVQIADALGVAATYVWGVLVKQYVVHGVAELLMFILGIVLVICAIFSIRKQMRAEVITWKIIPGIFLAFIALVAFCNVDYVVMLQGLINPDFGAINYILDFVKTM